MKMVSEIPGGRDGSGVVFTLWPALSLFQYPCGGRGTNAFAQCFRNRTPECTRLA